jgi:hypothetical protein
MGRVSPNLAEQGAITTPVGTVYGFEEVPRMIAGQAAPGAGKSVVRVAVVGTFESGLFAARAGPGRS